MLTTSLPKPVCWLLPVLALNLTGCGLTQSVTDGTRSAVKSIFYKKINVLHLDFAAREALNTDAQESNSLSESLVVRVYQLKDRKTFDKTVYQQLLQDGDAVLKTDLLASRNVVIKPGGDVTLDMPMEQDAKFVAVVGLFRHPDMMLAGNFTGGLDLHQVSEENQVILSVLDNMQRIFNCRAGTLAHVPMKPAVNCLRCSPLLTSA